MRRQLVLLLVLAALAGSCAAATPARATQEPTLPPAENDAANPFPDVGAPDCAADASAVDLARSRALALAERGGGSGFVVVTAAVVQVGSGARCNAGGGGGALELIRSSASGAGAEKEEEEIHLLLYVQCVHSGVLSCRANEDGGGGGAGGAGGPVDLSSACLLITRVPLPSTAADDKDEALSPTSSCTLSQGGKYTFLLQEEEEEEEEEAAAGGRRCQGRYRLAGSGVWDSVRPPSGLAACVPWPAWPEPPGVDEREAPGEIGALLTAGGDGRCPGGAPAVPLATDDWRAACSAPSDEQPEGAAGTRGRHRGACPPSSGVACFPRAACPGRMMLGQVLLPGLPPAEGEKAPTTAAAAAAYVDRVTGAPLGGCGAGLERARAQGRRVKRVAAAAAAGGEGRRGGQGGPLLPRRLGLATLAAAGR